MTNPRSEGEWLVELGEGSKAIFLAGLAHALTIAGRASYGADTFGLEHPEWLRQVNEIQHRVLACLRQVLQGEGHADFQRAIALQVLDERDGGLRSHMAYAWRSAKGSTPPASA